jgi:hypothetical protein
MAADMTGAAIKELISGKTVYVELTEAPPAELGRGVIYYAPSGTVCHSWNHVFHKVPADTKMNDKQKAMVDRAKASSSTMGVGIMATSAPPMVEYALTRGVNAQEAAKDAPSITVSLSDNTVLTIRRTSVDIRPDMCVWGARSRRPVHRRL